MDRPDTPTSRAPLPVSDHHDHPPHRHASPYRVLLVLAVGFVSLFLLIRGLAVEPFGVPTGSMAPALIGNHREGPCPRCGYPVRVGFPVAGGKEADHFRRVACPNCGYGRLDAHKFSLAEAIDLGGDRVLVDKNVFNLRRPRRWEMAVFRCPDPDPKEYGKPYVKRVVGLPGEVITLIDGDAFANHELLRKDQAEVREMRVPICDMNFVPAPGGWNAHWGADDKTAEGGRLTLDAMLEPAVLHYRNWNIDDRAEESVKAWSSYDGVPGSFARFPAAHDFSLECDVEVASAGENASFTCSLSDGADTVSAEVTVGKSAGGAARLSLAKRGEVHSTPRAGLASGRTYRVELAFVDRRVSFALDGRSIFTFDLLPVPSRGELRRPLRLEARHCKVVVRNLRLYRDTHYTSHGENGTRIPVRLKPGEYFMLGDNSANSQDSRKWPEPGVPEADFVGKPFLIHQPLRTARLSVGGRDRVFQTVDWSRLRWLH